MFQEVGAKFVQLSQVIDELLLHRVDQRLAKIFSHHGSTIITKTHQELAHEVGSSREVISRILAKFRDEGWIHLARGQLQILDKAALEAFSRSSG